MATTTAAERQLHLDPVGGIAGDMFVAAMLDAWPELADGAIESIRAAGLPQSVALKVEPHNDDTLAGTRFLVQAPPEGDAAEHVPFKDLRARLEGSDLAAPVRERAVAIFSRLAEAEGKVHGVPWQEVGFHEVGAWDSIADVVGAAHLIEHVGPARWSTGALPLGAGRVKSAHGMLPVPAPAVVELLKGFVVHDDGLDGERVTPTGAALLRHLAPDYRPAGRAQRLRACGIGFGTRRFAEISNVLRILDFEPVAAVAAAAVGHEDVAVVEFDVDDQSPEDLAVALERLRAAAGVLDVLQSVGYGKKGRLTAQIRLLAKPRALDAVLAACFAETTTIGLRWNVMQRSVLRREIAPPAGAAPVRVKLARRPDGSTTAKAEIDDVAEAPGGHAERARWRQAAEDRALGREHEDD